MQTLYQFRSTCIDRLRPGDRVIAVPPRAPAFEAPEHASDVEIADALSRWVHRFGVVGICRGRTDGTVRIETPLGIVCEVDIEGLILVESAVTNGRSAG